MNIPDLVILHLSLIEDVGPGIIRKFLKSQSDGMHPADLYSLTAADLQNLFGLTLLQAQKVVAGLADQKILEQECLLIEKHGISWITSTHPLYPSLLGAIHVPPSVLYYQGILPVDGDKLLAIVGSRKADEYGAQIIQKFVPPLIERNWAIVSGGALGADALAHKATLNAGGKTIAVLGSGLLRPAPHSNRKLFETILEKGGALISPFRLEEEPFPRKFSCKKPYNFWVK